MPTRPEGSPAASCIRLPVHSCRILRYQPWLDESLSIENSSLPAGRELFFIQGLFFV